MKFNKWTLGLAAVGVVSLASAAKADEKLSVVQTALSSTTISGYVDTAAHWNPGSSTGVAYYGYGGVAKSDGFNLNVVQLSISKPLDESEWASGYKVDLWMGPDANTLGTHSIPGSNTSDFTVKQAYVALRTPVGNGIDWKMGVFDTIIGYESSESPNNPNYTRSYGYSIEPTTHTGLLGTYRFCDEISMSAGIADTFGPAINGRAFGTVPAGNVTPSSASSYKTYMVSAALTAPQSWGWAAGSTLYAGFIDGFSAGSGVFGGTPSVNGPGKQTSWYAGATVATPVTGLKVGAAFDYLDSGASGDTTLPYFTGNDIWAAGVYTSYQATEKLSLHLRGELVTSVNQVRTAINPGTVAADNAQIWAVTGTVQYDLWQNVISRLEVRFDHGDETEFFTGSNGTINLKNSVLIAANLIYKF
jgi:hypothetical protein